MKILYTLNSGKPGGMEKHVLDLVKGMVDLGHQVFVWCQDGEIVSWFKEAGAEVTNRKIRFEIDPWYISSLCSFMKIEQINVVHAHELKAVCNALIAGSFAGVRVKISHTHTPISTWRINKFKRLIDKLFYAWIVNKFSDKEVALTKVAQKQKEDEGIREGKLIVIPNAINIPELVVGYNDKVNFRDEIKKRYSIPQSAYIYGCVGRLTDEKGHEVAVKAFKEFCASEPFHKKKYYLLIAGGGANEEKLRSLAKKIGVSDRVIITGVFERKDLVKYYSAMDTFIFPSLAEGFGFVLIEAMYFELPVICSDLDVLKEVGGEMITYFRAGSDEDLSDKMEIIYKAYFEGTDLHLAEVRERVEDEYSMEKFVNNYIQLYSSLLSK